MTLQYELESLDGVDENISKLYVKKDHKFVLDMTGLEKADNKDMIPKSRLDQEIEKKKAAEKSLKEVAEQLVDDVPKEKRSIIPNLPPAQKIEWLKSAFKMDFFSEKHITSIDSQRPSDQIPNDFSSMNPIELIEHGLKNTKK